MRSSNWLSKISGVPQKMNNIKFEAGTDTESSSDQDSDSQDEQDNSRVTITKREVSWCSVDTENHDYYKSTTRRVVWPPPSTSSSSSSSLGANYVNLRPTRVGTAGSYPFGNKMQLYSKTGHHLAVYPDGKVRGTPDENDLHTYLEILSAGFPGHVKIKGMLANMYVAMDHKGRLYAEADPMDESTVFIESFQGSYNAYLSRKYAHLGWYLGLKKSGKFKRGPKTGYGQKAVKFLPRRSKFQ